MNKKVISFIAVSLILILVPNLRADKPYRLGTTAANFLEIGYGSAGIGMGDAYVGVADDLSSVYWNPAGLAFMDQKEVLFMLQPWMVDVNTSFTAVGFPINGVGTVALSIIQMGFGEMEVTTMNQQEGTGELFGANEFAATVNYSRAIADWFGFGVGAKFISSQIWHVKGSAVAFDLGVLVKTGFFSKTGNLDNGLKIGMSISNYGTKMRYDGMDLLNPIDILPDEHGNYKDVPGQFKLNAWELPLIFRVGVSYKPFVTEHQSLTVAVDALHPNNNSESINIGAEYGLKIPSSGKLFLRGGYKALFMDSSEYGPTFGGGILLYLFKNTNIQLDYAFRDLGILGSANCFSMRFGF